MSYYNGLFLFGLGMSANIWLEDKYVNLLSSQLQRFTKKDSYVYLFRCPFCGDSTKNKYKSRGYIYKNKDHLSFKCHNCGMTKSIRQFIQDIDPRLYDEYRLEILKESGKLGKAPTLPIKEVKTESKVDYLTGLVPISHFREDHPVRKYIDARKIPFERQDDFLYCNRFMEWVNTVLPGKFSDSQLKMDEPRLIIPFYDAKGNIFAATGRSFKSNSIKYITVKFDENVDKIYGLDKIDPSQRVYVFEGPIDSMFINNSIAMAGSSGRLPDFKDAIVVLDNEPRNKDIVRLNEKLIESGRTICIWPKTVTEKDPNEMVMAGKDPADIKAVIDANAFKGLAAKIRLNDWRMV